MPNFIQPSFASTSPSPVSQIPELKAAHDKNWNAITQIAKDLGINLQLLIVDVRLMDHYIPPYALANPADETAHTKAYRAEQIFKFKTFFTDLFKNAENNPNNPTNSIAFINKFDNFLFYLKNNARETTCQETTLLILETIKNKHGTDFINHENEDGETLAHLFAKYNIDSGLSFLKDHGADLNKTSKENIKPIYLSITEKNNNSLICLMEYHTDESKTNIIINLLDFAILCQNKTAASILRTKGYLPTTNSINPDSSLLSIIASGRTELIYLSQGEELEFWKTKIHPNHVHAIKSQKNIYDNTQINNENFDEALIDTFSETFTPININMLFRQDRYGRTALHYAAMNPNPKIYLMLIQKIDETLSNQPNTIENPKGKTDNIGFTAADYLEEINAHVAN